MPVALLVRIIFWLWFAAAVLAGRAELLAHLPPFAVPGIVFSLTALLLAVYFLVGPLRSWTDELPLRSIVLLHVTRFVGIGFLVSYQRGELPFAFAVPGGIGDILVAAFALPVALAPLAEASRRRAITIWNFAGLSDILLVVATAARLNLENPRQMQAMTHLPYSLLPTFLVPLIIASHVVIFFRTSRTEAAA